MNWRDRMAERFFGDVIERRVQNAVKVIDDKWWKQIGRPGQRATVPDPFDLGGIRLDEIRPALGITVRELAPGSAPRTPLPGRPHRPALPRADTAA